MAKVTAEGGGFENPSFYEEHKDINEIDEEPEISFTDEKEF